MKYLYRACLILFLLNLSLLHASHVEKPETLEPEKIHYAVPRVSRAVLPDGILDEPVWESAVVIPANIEVQPGENIDAPVFTEARVAYTDAHLLVAIIAYDPKPHEIVAHLCDRDEIWSDDWVLILVDTFNDQRRTYDFACNPYGIQGDMIETPVGGGGSWDAIWESGGRITDDGYIIEMMIPFSSFSFPRQSGDQIWGFDVVRSYPRKVRHHIGSFRRDRNNNCYMCQSHKLVGFNGASPGRNLEFGPTLSGIYSQEREDEMSGPFKEKENKLDPGLTAHWGFTPNLTLSGALNPDFSNVEADILQLDINNQFAIYYPEKRPFFLKGADFFKTPMPLVHTRTLASPDWGMKVTGKEGVHSLGFYTVQDEMTNYLFPGAEGSKSENIAKKSYGSVLRYKRDVSKSSNIGALAMNRENDDYYNRMLSVDADIKFTSMDRIQVQVAATQTAYPDSFIFAYDQPRGEFMGRSITGYYEHDTEHWSGYALYREYGSDFRADLGFIPRVGTWYSEVGGSYRWRADGNHWYTWLGLYSSFDVRRDEQGNILHRANTFRFNYQGPMRSHGLVYGEIGENKYEGKTYRHNWVQGCAGYYPLSDMFVHVHWIYGDRIDYANHRLGTRYFINLLLQWKMGLHFNIELDHVYETMDVEPGHLYTANISRIKLVYQFNKRMFLRTIVQYKDYDRNVVIYDDRNTEPETKGIFTQVLFSYKVNPQTVFFLGYSDDYKGEYETDLVQTNRILFAKIGYAYCL